MGVSCEVRNLNFFCLFLITRCKGNTPEHSGYASEYGRGQHLDGSAARSCGCLNRNTSVQRQKCTDLQLGNGGRRLREHSRAIFVMSNRRKLAFCHLPMLCVEKKPLSALTASVTF